MPSTKITAFDMDAMPTGIIKSIQTGTGTIPANAKEVSITISAVNVDKTIVILQPTSSATQYGSLGGYARLTSSTNLTVTRGNTSDYTTPFGYQVIEFY